MMIKAFTLNSKGKIELSLEELQALLLEAENEGRQSVQTQKEYIPYSPLTTPSYPQPYNPFTTPTITWTSSGTSKECTTKSNAGEPHDLSQMISKFFGEKL